jgi:hypothetical protein
VHWRKGDCHPHLFGSFLLPSRVCPKADQVLYKITLYQTPGRSRCSCYSTNMMAKNQVSAYDSWCQDKIWVEALIGSEWRNIHRDMRYMPLYAWFAYSLFLAFSVTREQSIIRKAYHLSSWWMRYGMMKGTLLLFAKYMRSFLTKNSKSIVCQLNDVEFTTKAIC